MIFLRTNDLLCLKNGKFRTDFLAKNVEEIEKMLPFFYQNGRLENTKIYNFDREVGEIVSFESEEMNEVIVARAEPLDNLEKNIFLKMTTGEEYFAESLEKALLIFSINRQNIIYRQSDDTFRDEFGYVIAHRVYPKKRL